MGKVAEIKTKPTNLSVADYINNLESEQKRNDSRIILQLMEKAAAEQPQMWGSSMIGFGNVRYKSPATGREVDWFRIGFAPRKASLSLYLMDLKRHEDLLPKLGKHKTGAGCLYINKLADVDMDILQKIITDAATHSNTLSS